MGVWGGGLPSPPTPVAITAPAAGVVVFLASNNRCRGLVGSLTCACVIIGCDTQLHKRNPAPVLDNVAYISMKECQASRGRVSTWHQLFLCQVCWTGTICLWRHRVRWLLNELCLPFCPRVRHRFLPKLRKLSCRPKFSRHRHRCGERFLWQKCCKVRPGSASRTFRSA